MTATKNERAYVLDGNAEHEEWMRENPYQHNEGQLLSLTWYRHMMMYRDHEEGLNLIEQSFPQYKLIEIYHDNFDR